MPSLVSTIGHSTGAFGQFASLLRSTCEAPGSTTWTTCAASLIPDATRSSMWKRRRKDCCEGAGVGYAPAGPGRPEATRPRPSQRRSAKPPFRGCADHMRTSEFRGDVRRLPALRGHDPACLMRSEAVWWRCQARWIQPARCAEPPRFCRNRTRPMQPGEPRDPRGAGGGSGARIPSTSRPKPTGRAGSAVLTARSTTSSTR